MQEIDIIFKIIILIFSVVVHEVSHGYAALMLGDTTAKYQGRLTLNPLKHLDWFGSVILPLLLTVSGAGFVIGWAKPVPFNPYNLRNQRWGEAIVAFAGPLSNIIIALIFGLALRISLTYGLVSMPLLTIMSLVVLINLVLAIFNLVPIPPLDGSKILFSIFPRSFARIRPVIEGYGFILVLLFIFFGSQFIAPIVQYLFIHITGVYL